MNLGFFSGISSRELQNFDMMKSQLSYVNCFTASCTLGARGFFSLGVAELSGEATKASCKAARKNLWHQRITTSLPCRHQFPLINICNQTLFQKHSKQVSTWSKICVSTRMQACELSLEHYINLYSFESSMKWPFPDIFFL